MKKDPIAKAAEDEEKKRTLSSSAATKGLTKNPLRYVPDGLAALDKTEIRHDFRDIEKDECFAALVCSIAQSVL